MHKSRAPRLSEGASMGGGRGAAGLYPQFWTSLRKAHLPPSARLHQADGSLKSNSEVRVQFDCYTLLKKKKMGTNLRRMWRNPLCGFICFLVTVYWKSKLKKTQFHTYLISLGTQIFSEIHVNIFLNYKKNHFKTLRLAFGGWLCQCSLNPWSLSPRFISCCLSFWGSRKEWNQCGSPWMLSV